MILIKFGVLWTMYCSNVIITYYNISDTCLWIYNYFIENLVRKHLYCIWLKYPVRFDYNQWVFLIRSNFPYQILKHLYLNITCQEHALFLNTDIPTGRYVIGMYDYIFLIHVSCCFFWVFGESTAQTMYEYLFCLKIIWKKCFIPHRNPYKGWSLGVKKASQNCYWMALNLRKKEPLLSLKWFRIKK